MKKSEWKEKYIERMTSAFNDRELAEQCFDAVDFNDVDIELDDPVDWAEEEIEYWYD